MAGFQVTHFATLPNIRSLRHKPRRWPLVLRFSKGAIHGNILSAVTLHAFFTALVVYLHRHSGLKGSIALPPTIIPSLSIVVGLMLVFRNSTSYSRFWDGRNCIASITTTIRNLTRTILNRSRNSDDSKGLAATEIFDVERTIRILMAIPSAVKHYVRGEWEAAWAVTETMAAQAGTFGLSHSTLQRPSITVTKRNSRTGLLGFETLPTTGMGMTGVSSGFSPIDDNELSSTSRNITHPDFDSLLPAGLRSHEHEGLGFPIELTCLIDAFLSRGFQRGWFHAPGEAQLQSQLNALTDALTRMETIKLTPIPVAHLIHQRQVLALYGCTLPFAMVDELAWWAVPIVSLVTFTLYGIEGIGSQLEDPFGYDRNDIKMDAIDQDTKSEIETVLQEWKRVTKVDGSWTGDIVHIPDEEMFIQE